MRRIALSVVGFLAVAGAMGFLVTLGRNPDRVAGSAERSSETAPGEVVAADGAGGVAVVVAEPASGGAADQAGGSVVELPELPSIGPAVVRTARITIEVKDGGFGEAFDAATFVAGTYGGYVESSTMAGTETRSGELLLRVPSARFDEAMRDLRALGTVERQSMSGQDVTSQVVDLEARLRAWQAQEAALLELMAQADSVKTTLRIQSELQEVRFRIEQVQGQLRVLENQAELATIQVTMREAGAPAVTERGRPPTRPSLADAWRQAVDGFLAVVSAVIVGLGYLVPLSVLALLGWVGYRRFLAPGPTVPGS